MIFIDRISGGSGEEGIQVGGLRIASLLFASGPILGPPVRGGGWFGVPCWDCCPATRLG